MSYNKHNEFELCHIVGSPDYYISRDNAGFHVLREKSSDGKELFSPVGDDGKKNKKNGRVFSVELLYDMIETKK